MRLETIRSSSEIDRVFREGARSSSRNMVVLVSPTPEERGPSGRVAFIAGNSVGPAHRRNRAKRILREVARAAGAPWAGWDVILLARTATASRTPAQLELELGRHLRATGVIE